MSAVFWVLLPILVSVGSALLAVWIWQRRLEVQLARERQALTEARVAIEAQQQTLEELDRLRAEAARKQSLDDFMTELRTEQRRFLRQEKMLFANRKSLVVQERLLFRNIPLCNWVEHEVTVEEGANIKDVSKTLSVFTPQLLGDAAPTKKSGAALAKKNGKAVNGVVEASVAKMAG